MQTTCLERGEAPQACLVAAAHDGRLAPRSPRVARAAAGLLTAAVLAGCSTPGDSTFTVFADPGKYQYYSCEQIAGQIKHWTTREQELRALMDKAERGAGGAVVSVLAYRTDYVAATEELKVLAMTARGKNCEAPGTWSSNSAIQ
jgi:hypothetical protein